MKPYQSRETWQVSKAPVRGSGGLVSTQHYLASEAGASILSKGGNAVDAAVAAGLALGVVEPWMSGIGGGGFMQRFDAATGAVQGIDFAMQAPAALDPADYPLAQGTNAADKFNWPAVVDDRHTTGPYSIAAPGYLAGAAEALRTLGTMRWAEVMAPALELVQFGLPLDWYASHKIASSARELRLFASSARIYLPDGLPPIGPISGEVHGLPWQELVETYAALARDGVGALHGGPLGERMEADAKAVGSSLRARDLETYAARAFDGVPMRYRDATIWAPQGANAGPSLERALRALEARSPAGLGEGPEAYAAYAEVLLETYAERLATMGVAAGSGNTSHLGVVDAAGNVVSWTQTIMSAFGSKVVMPSSGITMNNGIMWFDPVPGRPNSIRPDVRPLSNMCPTIIERADGLRVAIGACGGRRIFPAVFQLISFLVDFAMSLDAAMHTPRIDVSGLNEISMDDRLDGDHATRLAEVAPVRVVAHGIYPTQFALPNVVGRDEEGCLGAAFVMSPTAAVVGI